MAAVNLEDLTMDDDHPTLDEFARQVAALAKCTYVLVPVDADRRVSIVCLHCGRQSFNPTDVAEKYCGQCHRFHGDPA